MCPPRRSARPPSTAVLPVAFAAALDDDLNVPEALAVLFGTVREGNRALDESDHGPAPGIPSSRSSR